MDGLFHGKSQSEMDDDWGYPYDLGNHRMSNVWHKREWQDLPSAKHTKFAIENMAQWQLIYP